MSRRTFAVAGLCVAVSLVAVGPTGCGDSGSATSISAAAVSGKWKLVSFAGKPMVEGGVQTTFELLPDGQARKSMSIGKDTTLDSGTWSLQGAALKIDLKQSGMVEYSISSVTGSSMELSLVGIPAVWSRP